MLVYSGRRESYVWGFVVDSAKKPDVSGGHGTVVFFFKGKNHNKTIKIVSDQQGIPTCANELSKNLWTILNEDCIFISSFFMGSISILILAIASISMNCTHRQRNLDAPNSPSCVRVRFLVQSTLENLE